MKLKILSGSIIVAVLIAAFLTWWPSIVDLRYGMPVEGLSSSDPDYCQRISNARPWYSTIDLWGYFWLATPFLGLLYRGRSAWKWRTPVYFLSCTIIGYVFYNLSLFLSLDIRNAPFVYNPAFDHTWEMSGHGCADIADGASMVFGVYLGWLLSLIYALVCFGLYAGLKRIVKLFRGNRSS